MPPRRRLVALAVALSLVAVLPYLRVVTFDYVQADDTDLVRDHNAFLRDLSNLPAAFGRSYFQPAGGAGKAYYRPLVIVSFMLDARVGGTEPLIYHATDLAIHLAAVLLLFALLRALGPFPVRLKADATSDPTSGAGDMPAFLASLLFAAHPTNAQAVCWIPGRNDSLMAVFAVASLVGLVRCLGHPRYRPHPQRVWLALHLAGFAAALFTKETAIVLPVLYVMYAGLLAGRLGEYLTNAPRLLTYAAIVLCWWLLRQRALTGAGDGLSARAYVETVTQNLPDLLLYIGKVVLPFNLSVMPGLDARGAALGMISLAALAWLFGRHLDRRKLAFVVAWFLLPLAPALLLPGLPAYEHRLYFPLMAIAIGISQLRLWSEASPRARRALARAVGSAALAFAAVGAVHAGVFRDRYTYWSSATRGTPYAPIAHVNVGQFYEADGDLDRAAGHYREALALDSATPGANNNLGVLMTKAGHLDLAREYFEQEIALHPQNVDAHYNLGLYYKLTDRPDEAAARWEQALAIDPSYEPARRQLAALRK